MSQAFVHFNPKTGPNSNRETFAETKFNPGQTLLLRHFSISILNRKKIACLNLRDRRDHLKPPFLSTF